MSKENEELFQKFANNTPTVCPRCGSTNCQFNLALEEQERSFSEGCFLYYIAMVLLLFIPVIGWILLYAIVNEKRKRKSVTYVLCNDCGNSWKLVSDEENNKLQKKKKSKRILVVLFILLLLVGVVIQFYFMAKYQGWI